MTPDPSIPHSAAGKVPPSTSRSGRPVAREEIVNLAEKIWRERGQPSGADDAIWLEAERRLQAEAEARPLAGAAPPAAPGAPARPPRPRTKISDPAEAPGALRPATADKENTAPGKLRSQ